MTIIAGAGLGNDASAQMILEGEDGKGCEVRTESSQRIIQKKFPTVNDFFDSFVIQEKSTATEFACR